MSKKEFRAVLDRAAAGDIDGAVEGLRQMHGGFVRGRLQHLMKYGGRDAPVAGTLHARLFAPADSMMASSVEAPDALSADLLHAPAPDSIDIDKPETFLSWTTAASAASAPLRFDELSLAQIWGLVGLAAIAQAARPDRPTVVLSGSTGPGRFAHALGLDALIRGQGPSGHLEAGRTVPLHRVFRQDQIESTARDMARLIVPPDEAEGTLRVMRYVLVELLRNVVQHSEDPLGGVVAAQVMSLGPYVGRPMIQVAVADAGIGIPASLRRMHAKLDDPRAALERALWPHISGAFPEGLTGTDENAGLGLFFIAEMTKLTRGRLMVATRHASLMLDASAADSESAAVPRFLSPRGIGFPGTLVAFELPAATAIEYTPLIRTIGERARARTPQRSVHHWISFDPPVSPVGLTVAVRDLAENTSRAARVAQERIVPAIIKKQRVALDFSEIEICTQSYLHALLYDAVRLAWATRTTIHVVGADAPVRSGIEFLEAYALGG